MRALFEKDTPTAQCQPWCQPVDIRWCKCSLEPPAAPAWAAAIRRMKIGARARPFHTAPPARRSPRQPRAASTRRWASPSAARSSSGSCAAPSATRGAHCRRRRRRLRRRRRRGGRRRRAPARIDDGGDDVEVGTVLAELRTSADLRRAALIAPAARRPRRQGARGRTSLLCRRKGCDEAAAPKVGRRELEEGDGDHDPDPGGEPGAEASARRLRCVASRRSALDLTYNTIIGTASAHRRRPQRRSRPARRRGRRRRAWRRRRASAPSSRSAARR